MGARHFCVALSPSLSLSLSLSLPLSMAAFLTLLSLTHSSTTSWETASTFFVFDSSVFSFSSPFCLQEPLTALA